MTSACTHMVIGADKTDSECKYKVGLSNEVVNQTYAIYFISSSDHIGALCSLQL